MLGNAMNLQQLAAEYGEFGWHYSEVFSASEEGANALTAPEGYWDIARRTCYIAVFMTAFKAGYINSEQLQCLEMRFSQQSKPIFSPYRQENWADMVRGPRFPEFLMQEPSLYLFFRVRNYTSRRGNIPDHVMFSLNGKEAAGSNNPFGPQDRIFAERDLSLYFEWDNQFSLWYCRDWEASVQIFRVPVSFMHTLCPLPAAQR